MLTFIGDFFGIVLYAVMLITFLMPVPTVSLIRKLFCKVVLYFTAYEDEYDSNGDYISKKSCRGY